MNKFDKLNTFEEIPVNLPEKEIFSRLKYNIHKTKIDDEDLKRIISVIKEGFSFCEPKGAWIRVKIADIIDTSVIFENNITIESKSIKDLLKKSDSALFFFATAGAKIAQMAEDSFKNGDSLRSVIYDAVGSETAEAAIDWLNGYIRRELMRNNESLTNMRFSPGYGDFLLENQKYFFDLLNMKNFGVSLNEKYIFSPEKTVTALAGIESNKETKYE
jgi:type II secretory pathway component PulC